MNKMLLGHATLKLDLQNFKLNSTGDLADHKRIVLTILF